MRWSLTALLLVAATSCGLDEAGEHSASSTGGTAGKIDVADSSFGGALGGAGGGAGTAASGGIAGGGSGAAGAAAGSGGVIDASLDAVSGGAAGEGGDAGPDASVGRVTNGLVLLYELGEAGGNKLQDTSGFGAAYDLTITDTNQVQWGASLLTVNAAVRIQNATKTTKLIDACKQSNALTVEVWLTPNSTLQGDHARVFGNSHDQNNRNFTLMQMDDTWGVRLRTTATSNNGEPALQTPVMVTTTLTHVLFTRGSGGNAAIYVNGVKKASATIGGDFSSWNAGYGSIAVNEFAPDPRPWTGDLHLIAVYCRAFPPADVLQNFNAGP